MSIKKILIGIGILVIAIIAIFQINQPKVIAEGNNTNTNIKNHSKEYEKFLRNVDVNLENYTNSRINKGQTHIFDLIEDQSFIDRDNKLIEIDEDKKISRFYNDEVNKILDKELKNYKTDEQLYTENYDFFQFLKPLEINGIINDLTKGRINGFDFYAFNKNNKVEKIRIFDCKDTGYLSCNAIFHSDLYRLEELKNKLKQNSFLSKGMEYMSSFSFYLIKKENINYYKGYFSMYMDDSTTQAFNTEYYANEQGKVVIYNRLDVNGKDRDNLLFDIREVN